MDFRVNEFEIGVNYSIFLGNEQRKMYVRIMIVLFHYLLYISGFHKSTLQQTGEVACVIKILLPLMYSRMVLMVLNAAIECPLMQIVAYRR